MSNFFKYLRAQTKRTIKLYPAILAFTLVLVIGVSIILSVMLGSRSESEENKRIRVGIVGDLDNSYLDIGISALKSMDTSRFYIEFEQMSEEQAKAELKTGKLMGYVHIPAGFVDSVANGGSLKLKYIIGNSPAVLSSLLMQEIIDVIGSIIVESQCAVYGYIDLAEIAELEYKTRVELANNLSVEYIGHILKREQWYDIHTLGIGKGLTFEGYYVCAFFILLFLLWGTVCVNLITKRDLSLQRLLFSKKNVVFGQITAEYAPFFGVFIANIIILFAAAGLLLGGKELPAFLPDIAGVFGFIKLGIMLIPAAAVISAMQFMLYELTSGVVSAVLLQILSLVALSYASGLLYPIYSLPQTLQAISPYLPTGVAFSYASRVMTGDMNAEALINAAVYVALFLSVAAVVRSIKIRGSRI
ncbi:MAG: ABC transporter permease [Ruminococcaceae bacterium]|nr:ABC transporter permease [Oscillospiraceae bacterium]